VPASIASPVMHMSKLQDGWHGYCAWSGQGDDVIADIGLPATYLQAMSVQNCSQSYSERVERASSHFLPWACAETRIRLLGRRGDGRRCCSSFIAVKGSDEY